MFFLKPLSSGGGFVACSPQKIALRSSIGLLKKKTTLRSCRHGRWYPSPRPGEWHQPEQSWYRVVDDIKSPQNFQGIFLILLLMDAWGWKDWKGNQWSKELFTKKNMNSAQMGFRANSRMWKSISKMWNQTPFCDMVIQALHTESWNPYNTTWRILYIHADHCIPWVALFETSCCKKIAGNCSWRQLCQSIGSITGEKFMGWTMGRDIKIPKNYYWICGIMQASEKPWNNYVPGSKLLMLGMVIPPLIVMRV